MKYKSILTEKLLKKEYLKNKKSIRQITKYLNIDYSIVSYWLMKYDIPRRNNSESHLRHIPWNKGKKWSEEIKKKIGLKSKGRISYWKSKKLSKEHRRKISKTRIKNKVAKGKNNPNFCNWSSKLPYSKEWTNELKEIIRRRDNYACQKCFITEEEHLIVYGKVLTVHHIDYDKENCNENNLITLCGECNTRVNFNRNYWKEYFKELIKSGIS